MKPKNRAPEATATYHFVLSGMQTPADQHLEALPIPKTDSC